jgi:hypothetical protein
LGGTAGQGMFGIDAGRVKSNSGKDRPFLEDRIQQTRDYRLQPRGMSPQLAKDASIIGSVPVRRRPQGGDRQ